MIAALVAFLLALNPPAASLALVRDRRTDRPGPVAAGAGVALAVVIALAAASATVLDLLDLSPGSFRLGAGAVITLSGVRWLLAGAPVSSEEPATDPRLTAYIAFPTLLTPGLAALALSSGARDGVAVTAAAAAVALAAGAGCVFERRRIPVSLATALVRLFGAGALIIGVGIAIDGARTF